MRVITHEELEDEASTLISDHVNSHLPEILAPLQGVRYDERVDRRIGHALVKVSMLIAIKVEL